MITPLGATADETAAAWLQGQNARCETIEDLCGTELEGAQAAVLPEFNPMERLGDRRMMKFMSDAALIGCVAAREAMEDADAAKRFAPERTGLFSGTGLAAARVREVIPMVENSIGDTGRFSYRLLGERGLAAANPLLSFKVLANMPPCLISVIEQIKGPNFIFAPWEGQTAAALLEAWKAVRSGEVECALAGAADYAGHPATVVYLKQSELISDGEYAAPGAAYLLLERRETAERGECKVYGEITVIEIESINGCTVDPLAKRMGRTFAAAPAILTALAFMTSQSDISCSGVDRQEYHAILEIAE